MKAIWRRFGANETRRDSPTAQESAITASPWFSGLRFKSHTTCLRYFGYVPDARTTVNFIHQSVHKSLSFPPFMCEREIMKRDRKTMWKHSNKLFSSLFSPQDLFLYRSLRVICGNENWKSRGLHGFTQFFCLRFYFLLTAMPCSTYLRWSHTPARTEKFVSCGPRLRYLCWHSPPVEAFM